MTGIQIPSQEIMVNCAPKVAKICSPLRQIGISFFSYCRIYNDGSRMNIGTNPISAAHMHYETKNYEGYIAETNARKLDGKILFTPTIKADYASKVLAERFQICNILSIINCTKDYTENFNFGTDPDDKLAWKNYLNNIDYLKKFKFYFFDQARSIIDAFKKNRLKTPIVRPHNLHDPQLLALGPELMVKRYYLSDDIYLTPREVECIKWLHQGKTADVIGILFEVSRRTVESHIESVKNKLGVNKQSQIVAKALELGII